MTLDVANEPAKMEEDLLEGAGKDLLQALEGVGTGAKQLAGQVIGQAVVMKSDEPEPDPPKPVEPVRKSGVVTRATRFLKDILAERRRHEQEEEQLEVEEEQPEERGVAQQALDKYERDMEAAQLSRKRKQDEADPQMETDAKKDRRSEQHQR